MSLDADLALIARACGAVESLGGEVDAETLGDDLRTLFSVEAPEDGFLRVLRHFARNTDRRHSLFALGEFVDIGDPAADGFVGTRRYRYEEHRQYLATGRFFSRFDPAACRAMLRTLLRIRRKNPSPVDDWDGIVRRWCDYVQLRELDLVVPPPLPTLDDVARRGRDH